MVITAHNVVLIISLLLFIAIFAGQASYKFGVPALIIFLGVGMLAGSEGIGKIQFGYEHADIAHGSINPEPVNPLAIVFQRK